MSGDVVAASAIIIRGRDQRVYVCRRKLTKTRWPGLWETIGGGLDGEETPEACIAREIREELGAEVGALRFFRDYPLDLGQVRLFVVSLRGEPEPNRKDFEECGWLSEAEVIPRTFASNCKDRLLDYFGHQHR